MYFHQGCEYGCSVRVTTHIPAVCVIKLRRERNMELCMSDIRYMILITVLWWQPPVNVLGFDKTGFAICLGQHIFENSLPHCVMLPKWIQTLPKHINMYVIFTFTLCYISRFIKLRNMILPNDLPWLNRWSVLLHHLNC